MYASHAATWLEGQGGRQKVKEDWTGEGVYRLVAFTQPLTHQLFVGYPYTLWHHQITEDTR